VILIQTLQFKTLSLIFFKLTVECIVILFVGLPKKISCCPGVDLMGKYYTVVG